MSTVSNDKESQSNDKDSRSLYRLGWGAVAGLTVVGILFGFFILAVRNPASTPSWFSDFCRAIGISYVAPPSSNAALTVNQGSTVAWTVQTRDKSVSGSRQEGAVFQENCVVCHGVEEDPHFNMAPHLDGMDKRSIFKQMVDYRERRRLSPVMNDVAAQLSDEEIIDLAAYFAAKPPLKTGTDGKGNHDIKRLVDVGDAARNIVPCAGCHGPLAYKDAAPNLFLFTPNYIETQLREFKHDTRKNDISAQMRSIAYGLTDDEIIGLAKYYGDAK